MNEIGPAFRFMLLLQVALFVEYQSCMHSDIASSATQIMADVFYWDESCFPGRSDGSSQKSG